MPRVRRQSSPVTRVPATPRATRERSPTTRFTSGLVASVARPAFCADPMAGRRPIGAVSVPASMFLNGPDPRAYVACVEGDCLHPKARSGDRIVVSPAAPLVRHALVALHFRDGRPPMVKQLICPPLPGLLSATGQVGSNVRGAVAVAMLNPAEMFTIPLSNLAAIHAVVAVLKPDEHARMATSLPGAPARSAAA